MMFTFSKHFDVPNIYGKKRVLNLPVILNIKHQFIITKMLSHERNKRKKAEENRQAAKGTANIGSMFASSR